MADPMSDDPLAHDGASVYSLNGDSGEASAEELEALADLERRSISSQAEDEPEDEGEAQQALELGDLPPTMSKLIPRGMPIEVKYKMGGKEVGGSGGLVDPNKPGQLIVSFTPGAYTAKPVREDGRVVRWKIIVDLIPTFVVNLASEAGKAALEGVKAA